MSISFEDVPYAGHPIPTSRLERLATEAWLRGIPAAHPSRARVLELGCAEGSNLIPHAYHAPEARFLGVDLSPTHIEVATARRDALGLDNLELLVGDIADLPDEVGGDWDYIVCHGVLSWVPPPVREAIWEALRARLAPHGVGYVSYNVRAGWVMGHLVREALLTRTRGIDDPHQKLREARALLQFIADNPFTEHPHQALLAAEAKSLLEHHDGYIAHDHMAPFNVGFRFGEIVRDAEAHALVLFAELSPIAHRGLEDRMRGAVASIAEDHVEREELADIVYGRTFRASLFVHEAVEVGAEGEGVERLLDAASFITKLSPTSARPSLAEGDAEELVDADGVRVSMTHPLLKAALFELARAFPLATRASDVVERAHALLVRRRVRAEEQAVTDDERAALLEDLVRLQRLGHMEIRLSPHDVVAKAGPRPRVTALARHESRLAGWYSSLFHEPIHVDDATRYLIELMDGARDRDELTAALLATLAEHDVTLRDRDGAPLEGDAARRGLGAFVERTILHLESQGVVER